jgi:Family of unknown function (DUF6529)
VHRRLTTTQETESHDAASPQGVIEHPLALIQLLLALWMYGQLPGLRAAPHRTRCPPCTA